MNFFTETVLNQFVESRLPSLRGQLACALVTLFLMACGSNEFSEGTEAHVKGFYGGVAGDEPQSVLEARKILSVGGSAADAATAMYFTLAVTLPSAASLGGGGSCMVFNPKYRKIPSKIQALEFFTRSPKIIPATATRPSAVPGNPVGIFALHSRYGRLAWGKLVAVGERLARFGTQASRALLSDLKLVEEPLLQDPESYAIFRGSEGSLFKEGDFFRQPDLANSLSNLRVHGPVDFYRGNFARIFVDRVNESGGSIALEDLGKYRPRWVKTVAMEFGKNFFSKTKAHFVPPPAAAGILQAQILGFLNSQGNFKGASRNGKYHLLAEAALIAYADRKRWMLRDFRSSAPAKELVSNSVFSRLVGKYSDDRHRLPKSFHPKPAPMPENPSATSFVVIDSFGMAVSCAFTMNNSFGIGRIARGTGIMIAAAPEGPGRGPISLGPMMIVNKFSNQFFLAASASGGVTAATAASSVIARSYLYEQSVEAALAEPRVHHSGAPDVTYYEPNLPSDVVSYLGKRGHTLAATPRIGLVNIAFCSGGLPRDPETCSVRNDPRGHGLALDATAGPEEE